MKEEKQKETRKWLLFLIVLLTAGFVGSSADYWKRDYDNSTLYTRNTTDLVRIDSIELTGQNALKLSGDAIVYNDMRVSLINAKVGATRQPSFEPMFDSVYSYAFSKETTQNEEQIFGEIQMSHNYKLNSTIECHVHYSCKTTSTDDVYWRLEWSSADIGETFPSATEYYVVAPCGNAHQHLLADFGNITSFSEISGIGLFTLSRASGEVNDTYTGDAFGLSFDCHYQIDSLGSREEYAK